jgi:hypothetical protein
MEWLFFVLIVIIVLLIAFHFSFSSEERLIRQIKKRIYTVTNKRKLVEKRFMKREISKSLFDALEEELQSEQSEQELLIVRMKVEKDLPIREKFAHFIEQVESPTQRLRAETKPLIKEISAIHKELEFLENKLLTKKINENVFEKLAKQRQLELIQKEAELFEILREEKNDFNKF